MSAEKHISTPTAVLIGSVVIAAGLFFGLRERSVAPLPAPPLPVPVVAEASSTAAAPQRAAPPAAASPPVGDRVAGAKEALAELESRRAKLVERCYAPAIAKKPEPKQVKLTFNVTFGPDGNEIMRGVQEDRASSRPEVTQCVMDNMGALKIAPQGASVFVEIPFTLP